MIPQTKKISERTMAPDAKIPTVPWEYNQFPNFTHNSNLIINGKNMLKNKKQASANKNYQWPVTPQKI